MELPPNRPKGQPIEFTYSYNENQIMHCQFKDMNSGIVKDIPLKKKGINFNIINENE